MNITVEIRAKPGKFQEFYQTIQSLLLTLRKENGCLESRIYRDVEDDEVFFLSISWENAEQFENYLRSVNGSALLGAIDLLGETAKVKIDGDKSWRGIEILKRIRKGS